MKALKTAVLTLLLTIGLIIPGCIKDSCNGVIFLHYFDVSGISLTSYSEYSGYGDGISILPNDTISLDSLDKIYIDYQVDYVVSCQPKQDWSFSLMPAANACSYIPGARGSKEEALVNFSIITLNDFDADHLANTNINDLFDYYGFYSFFIETPIPLTQFLEEQTGILESEDMVLELKKAPELNQEFKVKLVMELSTGEIFEEEPAPIIITP